VKNAIQNDDVWGKIFNIGGGRKCRTTYKEYLGQMMKLFGMGNNLPDSAFSEGPFHCGWLNTEDSASLLKYQKTTLNDFYKRVKRRFLGLRIVLWLFRPLARKIILNYSKYYHKRQSKIASWTKSKVLS